MKHDVFVIIKKMQEEELDWISYYLPKQQIENSLHFCSI